jgi:hypothetical protein
VNGKNKLHQQRPYKKVGINDYPKIVNIGSITNYDENEALLSFPPCRPQNPPQVSHPYLKVKTETLMAVLILRMENLRLDLSEIQVHVKQAVDHLPSPAGLDVWTVGQRWNAYKQREKSYSDL